MRRALVPLLVLLVLPLALPGAAAAPPATVVAGVVSHTVTGETATPCEELTPFEFAYSWGLRLGVATTKPRPAGAPGCLGLLQVYGTSDCREEDGWLRCARGDAFAGSWLTVAPDGTLEMEAWQAFVRHTLSGLVVRA